MQRSLWFPFLLALWTIAAWFSAFSYQYAEEAGMETFIASLHLEKLVAYLYYPAIGALILLSLILGIMIVRWIIYSVRTTVIAIKSKTVKQKLIELMRWFYKG